MGDELEMVFEQLALTGIETLLRDGLILLALRGLATMADLELLDELAGESQPQSLAA